MQILVNGEAHRFETAPTITQLLDRLGHGGKRVAVEVNRTIVPRSRHDAHRLSEGDEVELVHAIGGG